MTARTDTVKTSFAIREATELDAGTIAELLAHLGYPASRAEVEDRLGRLGIASDSVAFVAESRAGVLGVVTGHVFASLHVTPVVAWLTTLVVSSGNEKKGIGRTLVGAVEEWARGRRAVRISVTLGFHREAAHEFYEHMGYQRTGVRLTRALMGTTARPAS
jgi:GNAT superfamily N-acetyltransferase